MEKEFNDMRDVFKVLPTTQEEKEYRIVLGKHLATTEKYIFTKQERRLICEKTYDKDVEDLKKWNHKQLKLF